MGYKFFEFKLKLLVKKTMNVFFKRGICMRKTSISVLVVALVLLGGCATNQQTGELVGGLGGAAIGSQFGHGGGRLLGAGIGAAAGALLGGAVGQNADR